MIEVSIRKLGAARSTLVMATKATMLKLVMSLALIGGALGLPTLYKKRARHPAGDAEHDEKPRAHSTHKLKTHVHDNVLERFNKDAKTVCTRRVKSCACVHDMMSTDAAHKDESCALTTILNGFMKAEFNDEVLDLSAVVEQEKKMGYHRPRRSIEDAARKLRAEAVTDDECAMYEDENGEVCRKRRAHAGCRVGHTPSMFRDKCEDLPGTLGRGVPNLCPLETPMRCDDGSCVSIDGKCPEDD